MKIAITGASGFVGSHLSSYFGALHTILPLGRQELSDPARLSSLLEGVDWIINLAGAPIIAKWSESYKKVLYSSRIETTRSLLLALKECPTKPSLFTSTSAIGIYDNQGTYTENDLALAQDFLGNLAKDWEEEALKAQDLGIRTVVFRFGVVLGKGGGMMEKIRLPFSLGLGGVIGDGKQKFSWIHLHDIAKAMEFAWNTPSLSGTYNLTAPSPTTNEAFTKLYGSLIHRPTLLPVPLWVLQILFGEGAKVLSDGQAAIPERLLQAGFEFEYPTLEKALKQIIS